MAVIIVEGDLLDQQVDALVNAWNTNWVPWWLLLPHGVAGAFRRRAGHQPFRELSRAGIMRLGDVYRTSAGRLPHKAILHAAGIWLPFGANEAGTRRCVRNALAICEREQFRSVAFPLIGAGVGGCKPQDVERWMVEEAQPFADRFEIRIVRFRRPIEQSTLEAPAVS